MSKMLRIAAIYNVLWGCAAILLPATTLGLLLPDDQIVSSTKVFWQCIGMIVGVYGVGYWIAAADPYRHWPIVLVGLLGKILGPIGFIDAALIRGTVPSSFGYTILTNDLVWWIPFTLTLLGAYRATNAARSFRLAKPADLDVSEALQAIGREDLVRRSHEQDLLIVFLRHFGCTFCRETLSDLAKQRTRLGDRRLVLVHMLNDQDAASYLQSFDLPEHDTVSDPDRTLYRAFGLTKGKIGQLFGARVWLRGFEAGILSRHGVGKLAGDGFQMPGAFVVSNAAVVAAFAHEDAADRVDYPALCELPSAT